MITRVMPLDDNNKAFDLMRAGESNRRLVVLQPPPEIERRRKTLLIQDVVDLL